MTILDMLQDLKSKGLIADTQTDLIVREPDNYIYSPTATSYNLPSSIQEEILRNAKLG
ncbi:MAG: hypothetical protein AAGC79_13000 [Pseudomonadota bacterium]